MSTRALKRLLECKKKQELDVKELDIEEQNSDDGDEEEEIQSKGKTLNPFDLLNQEDLSESEVKMEHASMATNLLSGPAGAEKKKKKRKKNTKKNVNRISKDTDRYLSDIDSLIGKVCDVTNQNPKLSTPPIEINKSLLSVQLKNLNPRNEVWQIFGVKIKRERRKFTLKRACMVTPQESWRQMTKNITMKRTQPPAQTATSGNNSKSGAIDTTQWFTFEHNQYYQSVQKLFLKAMDGTESDFHEFIERHIPYHIDSLIQMSEMHKEDEEFLTAAEFIEHALYGLESSLHPRFSLISGNCRLDYRRQENRSFFILLFKYAQILEGRICFRTAFEISKLILSLSPDDDPLEMVLILDFYALRSKQYAWLVQFYEEYDAVRNLSLLPNMAYSYALALFCLHGECEKADKALQYALLMFPGILSPFINLFSVATDQLAASYFNVSESQSPALHQLVCLYNCRTKEIWSQSNTLPWLERNVKATFNRIDSKDEIIATYEQKRATSFIVPSRSVLRHVILSDYEKKVPLAIFVAKEQDPIYMYDPLPPFDSFYSSDRPTTASGGCGHKNAAVGADAVVDGAAAVRGAWIYNPITLISLLFQSCLDYF